MTMHHQHRAYHELRLTDGTLVDGPVSITFDDDDNPVEWHHLTSEEPFTVWIGGVFCISEVRKTDL